MEILILITSFPRPSHRTSDVDCPYSSEELEDFTEEELEAANSISTWLRRITDPEINIVEILQDQHHHDLPQPLQQVECEDQGEILKVIGERDEEGLLDGEVEMFYKNGDYFWGGYRHGVREGAASLVTSSGDHFLGTFSRGLLDGLVTETLDFADFHNITREVFYKVRFSRRLYI